MTNYEPRLSSLFAMMARGAQNNDQAVVVVCTNCGSDDTKPVDLEHDIYECTCCGEVFTRQPKEAEQ